MRGCRVRGCRVRGCRVQGEGVQGERGRLDLLSLSEHAGVVGLVAFHVGEGDHQRAARELGDAAQVLLLAAAHRDGARLDKVLEGHVVDALGREDDVGARAQDEVDALLLGVRVGVRLGVSVGWGEGWGEGWLG